MKLFSFAIFGLALVGLTGCKTNNATPQAVFNVRDFGAVGDGTNNDTVAFQKGLDACATRGGQLVVPPGNYLIGSVQMSSHTTLQLEQGTTLTGSGNTNDYPMIPIRWEGRWEIGRRGLIYATNADDIAIIGPGKIIGNPKMAAPQNPRGSVVLEPVSCHGVWWENFSVTQGGNWATHPTYCTGVVIRNLNITGRRDGIDVDSCSHVLIDGCTIETSDDSISLKSGRGKQAVLDGRPTDNVVITNCTLIDHRFASIGIGSETSGGVHNVRITHCRLNAYSAGIYIKTRIGRGGAIENISADDLDVTGGDFLRVNLISSGNSNTADDPVAGLDGYPVGKNYSFTNVRLENVKMLAEASKISPQRPLDGFVLSNITGICAKGINLANITHAAISGIKVSGYKGKLLTQAGVQGTGLDIQ
ncbi:MAG TPA: glycosyl hydrolase family 28-related protein [Verrucomicrobiae bacterium]